MQDYKHQVLKRTPVKATSLKTADLKAALVPQSDYSRTDGLLPVNIRRPVFQKNDDSVSDILQQEDFIRRYVRDAPTSTGYSSKMTRSHQNASPLSTINKIPAGNYNEFNQGKVNFDVKLNHHYLNSS